MKPWALFRNVLWPAWRLPLTLAISIVFCLGLLQFEVPSLLQIDVYPLEIYIRFTAFLNEWSALILSLPYVAVAVFLCWALSRITPHISMNGSEFTIQPYTQSVRVLLSVGVCAVFLLSCFVPLFGSFIHIGSIGLFLRTFAEHWENILRSVFYCAAGSFCIIGLGFWYTAVETNRDRWFAPSVFLSLFVLPGILIASAWLRVRSFWPGVLPGGVALLSLLGGYITHYFILGYGAGLMLWRYYGERQKEFDSLLKLGMFYRIRRLIVPILWRPGLRATALIALLLWGDAGMTVLLHPPGKESLSVEYFNLLHYGTEARTAAIGSIMMLMPASILLLIFLGTGWKSRQS